MAVKLGPCLLTVKKKKNDPGLRNQRPKETSPHLLLGAQDQQPGVEQGQLYCGSTGISSGDCQDTETGIVRACHTPLQPLQNHPPGHLGGWATLWLAEEMLDAQHQRVDIPVHARTAQKGLLWKRLEEDLCWIIPHASCRPNDPIGQGLGTEPNHVKYFFF